MDLDQLNVAETLDAVDPAGCVCPECLAGRHRPLQAATTEEAQALFLGQLRDNTGSSWDIEEHDDGGFYVYNGPHAFFIGRIVLPIPVGLYRLEARQTVIAQIYDQAPYISRPSR